MRIRSIRPGGRRPTVGALAAALLALPASAQAGLLGTSALPASAQAARPGTSAPQAGTSAGRPATSALTRAPYLTDLTQTSVRVTWATARQSQGVVKYGPPGRCTAHSVVSAERGRPITVKRLTEYQNSVTITGLSPAASYCYRIATAGRAPVDLLGREASPRFSTLEPATSSRPLTFDVMDDWGDTTNRGRNNGAVNANQAAIDSEISSSGARFLISIGDTAYQEGSQTNYGDLHQTGRFVSGVFGRSYWAAPGQHIPVFQGNGDHGQTPTTLSVWPEAATTAASGGKDSMVRYRSVDGSAPASYPTPYYAFSTAGVRFYVLDATWGDTNQGSAAGGPCGAPCTGYQVDRDAHWTKSSAEYRWLAKDLAAHRGGLKFAFFHFPLYSDSVAQPSDRYLDNTPGRTGSLEQLLHGNGVDLVFNGHAHDYQRNVAVRGGVTSYVTGGGGGSASQVGGHGCAATDAYAVGWFYSTGKGSACGGAARPATDADVYQFLKVTVHGALVTVVPINARGRPFDIHVYNFAHDASHPSAPGRLSATRPGPATTVLHWTHATDNIGVSAYDIYRDGWYRATVRPGATSYTDSTARARSRHTYQVVARDLAGNTSSATVKVGGRLTTHP
jgi:hypothetical protein